MAESHILDHRGEPVTFDLDPVEQPDRFGEWHVPPVRRSRGLTPAGITRIFDEADGGWPQAQAELYEDFVLKDGKIAGLFLTRVQAPAQLDWKLHPASTDDQDVAIAEWLREKLGSLELWSTVFHLAKAVGFGYAAEQILWRLRGDEVEVAELRHWPTRYLLPDVSGEITKYSTASGMTSSPLPPGKFVVHQPESLSEDAVSAGLLRTATWYWYFKNFCLKSWLQYAETYGQPLRWATYPPGTSPEEKSATWKALMEFGRHSAALLPEGFELQLVEAKGKGSGGGGEVYERLKAVCDEEIAILLLGQTLTSSIGEGGGAFAAAKVHEQVRQDLVAWDARQLATTLRRELITPWVRFQFGNDVAVPKFELDSDPPDDLALKAKTTSVLVKDIGLPVTVAYLYETFGIPAPEGDEAVVGGAAASSASTEAALQSSLSTLEALHGKMEDGATAGKAPGRTGTRPADLLTW